MSKNIEGGVPPQSGIKEKEKSPKESKVKIKLEGDEISTYFRPWNDPDRGTIRNVPTLDSKGREIHPSVRISKEWFDINPELAEKLEEGAKELERITSISHDCVVRKRGNQLAWEFRGAGKPGEFEEK